MREIKFRGKPTDNNTSYFKDFVEGSLVIQGDKYYILLDINEHIKRDDYEVYMIEVIPKTVGQYTGLKDKNGKEIYEGDIVKQYINGKYRLGIIIYEYTGFCIDVTMNKELFHGKESVIETFVEVIGNIYENKDLLEVSNAK